MNKQINEKYKTYPPIVKQKMLNFRELILEVIEKNPDIDFTGEALKWDEPSFLTKSSGSTLRIDWKKKSPEHVSIFVNCQTKLISIFRELYPDDFEYVGNREVRLPIKRKYSKVKVKKLIELVLKYNLIKGDF